MNLHRFSLVITFIILTLSFAHGSSWIKFGELDQDTSKITSMYTEDRIPPSIWNLTHSPKYPQERDKVSITVIVMDNGSGVKEVVLEYYSILTLGWYGQNWGWGNYEWKWWAWEIKMPLKKVTMTSMGNSIYKCEILELPYMSKVLYQVFAYDKAGNTAISDIREYNVVRGMETIILQQVYTAVNWIIYLIVALVVVGRV